VYFSVVHSQVNYPEIRYLERASINDGKNSLLCDVLVMISPKDIKEFVISPGAVFATVKASYICETDEIAFFITPSI
jgi:hypothetical protein